VQHLRSQPDFANWTLPHLDTLHHHNELPGAENQMPHIRQTLQGLLDDAGLHITNSRSMPHYALFEVQAASKISDDLLNQLGAKLSRHPGWMVGIQPQSPNNTTLHILIQTDTHRPMTLQQIMVRPAFRKNDSARQLILGVTLDQHIMMRSLESLQQLIVAGDDETTQHFIRSMLVTLLLANTPSQLRIALIGSDYANYSHLTDTPHVLGKPVSRAAHGILLLNGMLREVRRRQAQIRKAGCNSILEYNAEYPQSALPHILIVSYGLSSAAWMQQPTQWLDSLSRIIRDGSAAGIHPVLIVPDLSNELLHPLYAGIKTKLMTRTLARDNARHIDNFNESLWHFVDAVVVEHDAMKPVEIPIVTESDTATIATYWRKNAETRIQANHLQQMTQKGGITSLFHKLQKDTQTPTPPVPQPPPAEVLAHAASVLLSSQRTTQEALEVESSNSENKAKTTITPAEANINTVQITAMSGEVSIQVDLIHRAHALASYLGWLGRGPLMDVLGLSLTEADLVIAILQARQILERNNTPTPRLRAPRSRFDSLPDDL
jgi:FtsK/SpoIIIE family